MSLSGLFQTLIIFLSNVRQYHCQTLDNTIVKRWITPFSPYESEEAAAGWRNQIAHRASQKKGHDALFEHYRISVGEIIREYTNDSRSQAPADSNTFLSIK